MKDEKKDDRPLAYPKPTETDTQMKEQGEYLERQSSRRTTQSEGADTQQDIEQMRGAQGEQMTEGTP